MESKKSWEVYNNLIEKFGTEFEILLNVKKEALLSKKIENKLIPSVKGVIVKKSPIRKRFFQN